MKWGVLHTERIVGKFSRNTLMKENEVNSPELKDCTTIGAVINGSQLQIIRFA